MRLTAQEEYGVRCLLQVARRAPAGGEHVLALREIAEAEGLSVEYAAKLLRILRQGELVESERGASGGYRLARAADSISLAQVMHTLDTPLYGADFCSEHAGQHAQCVHQGGCALRPVWQAVDQAVTTVLAGLTLWSLLEGEPSLLSSRSS